MYRAEWFQVVRLVVIEWRVGFVPSCENSTSFDWNKILSACTKLQGIPDDERLEVVRVRFPTNWEYQKLDKKKFSLPRHQLCAKKVELCRATLWQNSFQVLLGHVKSNCATSCHRMTCGFCSKLWKFNFIRLEQSFISMYTTSWHSRWREAQDYSSWFSPQLGITNVR